MELNRTSEATVLVSDWRDLLLTETKEIDRAGVQAAVVAIRLLAVSEDELATDARRAQSLLKRRLHSTDRLGVPNPHSFSILLSPTIELTKTVEFVRSLGKALIDHRVPALTSFAHRRPEESLIDTWARAEAELDRSLYRHVHGNGISL